MVIANSLQPLKQVSASALMSYYTGSPEGVQRNPNSAFCRAASSARPEPGVMGVNATNSPSFSCLKVPGR